jgi:hypothetical protein
MTHVTSHLELQSPLAHQVLRVVRVLLPVFGMLALIGYFAPWVNHKAAGLAILGIDWGETVKFLPAVRGGSVSLWREGFYAPLVAISLTISFYTYRVEFGYPWLVKAGLLAVAVVAALNLLPPAWTPHRMLTPEFQQQMQWIVISLAAVAFSPLLALLPRWLTAVVAASFCLIAAIVPVIQFLQVLPNVQLLYSQPISPGWGMWAMIAGLLGLICTALWTGFRRSPP